MHPVLRVGFHTFLPLFSIFLFAGCNEYNPHPPLHESAALTNITQLTHDFARAGDAAFSHDLRWIIFRAVPAGGHDYQLYLAKTDWKQGDLTGELIGIERPIRITPAGARSAGGSFSPDGLSLIFSTTAGGSAGGNLRYPIDMHICRVDGWEGAVSMTDTATGIDLARNPLLSDHAYNAQCRFSPDGSHIVFTSTRGGQPNLWICHADGSHLVQLTKTPGDDGQASFSPDGKHLLYTSRRASSQTDQIYLADLSFDPSGEITGLKNEHPLTSDQNVNTNPSWFPDGSHIIYTTSRHGRDNYELYLMDRKGKKKTRITDSPGADLFPVFSPSGHYLMWTSKRSADGSIQVFIANFEFPFGS